MRPLFPLLVCFVACSTQPDVPAQPTAIQLIAGSAQTGVPGYRLATPVVVKIADSDGRPVPGDTVTFTLADPSGDIEPGNSAVTDSAGEVSVYWRLGGTLGQQTLAARTANVAAVTVAATAASNHMQSIDGGYAALCGVDDQGRLGCWKPPLLHLADVSPAFRPVSAPVSFTMVTVPVNVQRTSVDNALSGQGQGCALTNAGRLWCFTLDTLANMSGLAEMPGSYPAFSQVVSADEVVSYCGLTAAGEAWCWGNNSSGQLGDGTVAAHSAPAPVLTSARFIQMDMDNQACGVTADGAAWCWGRNSDLEAGSGTGGPIVTTPVLVNTALRFSKVRVDAFLEASCGFSATSGMSCWGNTQSLGAAASSASPSATPVAIATASQPLDMVVSSGIHFEFNQNASMQWSGTAGFREAVEGGSGGSAHLVFSQVVNLLRDVQIAHGSNFICGTAVFGGATLCPSTAAVITNHAGVTLPMVVGVPFP